MLGQSLLPSIKATQRTVETFQKKRNAAPGSGEGQAMESTTRCHKCDVKGPKGPGWRNVGRMMICEYL